jgi:peptidoglycan/LPS O-acetylase OafA/YrhL
MLWGSLSIISHEGNSLDVVTWSLFYEVWLSLAFPLLLLAFWRWHLAINLVSGFLLILLSVYWWRTGDLLGNPWQSLIYYSWYFLLGLLLFRCHERIKFLANPWLLIIGCGLYFSNYLLFGKISSRLLHEIIIAFGSSLILLNGLHYKPFKALLNWLPFRFYGKISYSLYLFHLPVLYTLSYLLLAQHAIELVKIATLIITTLLAVAGYYLVELPSINVIKSILHKSSR